MKKQKNATRIIAIVLVLLMALALVPIAASAAAPDNDLPCYIRYLTAAGEASTTPNTDMSTDSVHLPASTSSVPEGKHFLGWAVTSGAEEATYTVDQEVAKADLDWHTEPDDTPTANYFDLYEVWGDNPVVTFDGNGATTVAMDQQTVGYNVATQLNANTFVLNGWTFQGWGTSATSTTFAYADQASVTITEDLPLYAIWQCTVTYDLNGGSGTAPAQPAVRGQSVTLPAKPTKQGFTFIGWKVGDTSEVLDKDATSYEPEGDVTLTAQWADTVTITYAPNGGTGSMSPNPDSTLRDSDYTIAANGFSQSGKAFSYWLDSGTDPAKTYKPGDPLDWTSVGERIAITLTAQWLDLRTVTFNVNCEGATVTPASVQVADGATIGSGCSGGELPVPTSADYNFIEWNANSSGTGSTVTKNTTVSGANMQVYGKWISKTIPVTFDLDGGTPAMEPAAAARGADYTLPECTATKADSVFAGWTIGSSDLLQPGATYAVGATSPDSLTVKANWKNAAVTVKYNANGGTGNAENTMSRATAAPLMAFSSTGIAKSGSVFLGWVTDTAHTTPDFTDEAIVKWDDLSDPNTAVPATPGDEVTLYALWESRLTGTVTIDNTTPKVGDTLTATPNVTPASENLFYRWKVNGKAVTGANAQTFEVPPDAYGYPITVEVTNDSNFAYVIASNPTSNVAADESSLTTITVAFAKKTDDVDYTGYVVKVNGSAVHGGQNDIKVPKNSTVVVTLESGTNTTAYVSELQLGTITLEGSEVAAVNNIKAPDDATCTLTVTFAKKTGTNKTATIDPNADTSAAKTSFTTAVKAELAQKVAEKKIPADQQNRYWVNALNVVPCWDNQVTNTLKPGVEPTGQIPAEGLKIENPPLPYPAGSDFNATVAANMPKYYDIEVYHKKTDGTVEVIPDARVTKGTAFTAGVTVTGQTDFSPFGVALTPKALTGTVTVSPTTAYVGKDTVTATYSNAAQAQGTLKYQWQARPKDSTDESDWTNVGTGQTYTPAKNDRGKYLRCVVTSSFETGELKSNNCEVAAIPNPEWQRDAVNNTQTGIVKNVTSDMMWSGPSSTKPGTSATWHSITGTTFEVTEQGNYWVRFADDTSNTNVSEAVYVANYFTVICHPDSVSANRLYFEATTTGTSAEVHSGQLSLHPDVIYDKNNSSYYWIKQNGTGITVYARTRNSNYYKITGIRAVPAFTGSSKTGKSDYLSVTIGKSYTVRSYDVWASAGVYGSKTGDTSHLELWVELAALSLMGLGAALVIGRKKLKAQK